MILDEIISSVKQGKNILILGDDVDKITKFYSVLDKEIKDEKEKYITTNLLNSTVEDKEKFSKHFKKNKENLETANNFLEFDCFYTMGDNYTYFVTEK